MKTIEEKKEFALAQIAPYYKDPTICGFDGDRCLYLTEDGKMCVAGKNMLHPNKYNGGANIQSILEEDTQELVLKPEIVDILSNKEWRYLQSIHDFIADRNVGDRNRYINLLNLFTFEELEEYAVKL